MGFPTHQPFDRGTVDIRAGEHLPEISQLQPRLTIGQQLASAAGLVLSIASGLGIIYALGKVTLVRKGEVGLAESMTGNVRALGPGWHIMETIGTRVLKAPLTSDVIQHGMLKIIRVLPGRIGLGVANGHPVFLLPGRHLIVDPLFTFAEQVRACTLSLTLRAGI